VSASEQCDPWTAASKPEEKFNIVVILSEAKDLLFHASEEKRILRYAQDDGRVFSVAASAATHGRKESLLGAAL
jgi:hypothetical protein